MNVQRVNTFVPNFGGITEMIIKAIKRIYFFLLIA